MTGHRPDNSSFHSSNLWLTEVQKFGPAPRAQALLGLGPVPIRTISLFTYRTHGRDWTASQIAVLHFVRALKGEGIGDRRNVLVNGVARSLGDENADEALGWFGEMAAAVLIDELGTTDVVLVPVPDSASASEVTKCRTCWLADAVAEGSLARVQDVLRWREPKRRAHEGGPRSARELVGLLCLRGPLADVDRPFVLVDDVTTGGGHIQASAAVLRAAGASLVLAVCGAQGDAVTQVDPFQRRVVEWADLEPDRCGGAHPNCPTCDQASASTERTASP